MAVTVSMPGSCGELVQGAIDGHDFHITCPIDRYSHVTVHTTSDGSIAVENGLDKTAAALQKSLEVIGIDRGIRVDIKSELPHGKGMASSTADIAAAIIATFELFDRGISAQEIARMALSIEPTDGTIFEGIVAFDHLKGHMLKPIALTPPVEIIVLEPPKTLDTVAFNKDKKPVDGSMEYLYKEVFNMAVEGIERFDIRLIGEAATLSSTLNQKLLYKPELDDVIEVCKRKGAAGVNIAHSGTVMGVLVERGYAVRVFEKIAHYIPKSWNSHIVNLVNGGPRRGNLELDELRALNEPIKLQRVN